MYDPSVFKRANSDHKNADIEDIMKREERSESDIEVFTQFAHALLQIDSETCENIQKIFASLRKRFKCSPRNSDIIHVLDLRFRMHENYMGWRSKLVSTKTRSKSGVVVITVLTSPYPEVDGRKQTFSCKWNCYYCPNEPDQPRSYLHDEPAVIRANVNNFDPVLQFFDRAQALQDKGHEVDKIELIVLGGTWESYPLMYRKFFIRDLFYAANEFGSITKRPKRQLEEEQIINETARCKIIGLTLETRPDTINADSIRGLREVGCTRVQLGVQHTDDAILKKINRKCTLQDTKTAIEFLKNACYKVDIHLMPNLPGSNIDMDFQMFKNVLYDPDLQADQWKIYPCEVVPWTVIEKWYHEGSYFPYSNENLIELLIKVKSLVHPYIRLNRVVRDIPSQYIFNDSVPNLRNELEKKMSLRGLSCACIRCREPGDKNIDIQQFQLKVRKYEASGANEYFLSFEHANICAGFLRLRLPRKYVFPEMNGMAFVRELHVYGKITPVHKTNSHIQHAGLGSRLLKYAEYISFIHGYKRIAVISGVGTRDYYRKRGYTLMDQNKYLIKKLYDPKIVLLCLTSIVFIILSYFKLKKCDI